MLPGPVEEKGTLKLPAPAGILADAEVKHRFEQCGASALTNAELLGLLLKSPNPYQSSADFARTILDSVDGTLSGLKRLTYEELAVIPGYGATRARTFMAALELGRRRRDCVPEERRSLTTSQHVFDLLHPHLMDLLHEEFWLVFLDRGNRLIRKERTSMGGMHGTVADPKLIFHRALALRASSIIVSHNHPSGQLRPSEEDIRLTRKLVEAGRFLDIGIHDHVIMTDKGYYSFADNGMLH